MLRKVLPRCSLGLYLGFTHFLPYLLSLSGNCQ